MSNWGQIAALFTALLVCLANLWVAKTDGSVGLAIVSVAGLILSTIFLVVVVRTAFKGRE